MNKKKYIIISIFFLLSLILTVFFIRPYFLEIKTLSKKLVLEESYVSAATSQVAEMSRFKERYNGYRPNLERIDNMFIDPQDPIEFIEFLENNASDSNIVSQVFPEFLSQRRNQSVVFQIYGRGNLSDFLIFLKKIERGPYFINVEGLNISVSKGGTSLESKAKELSAEVQADIIIEVLSRQ